MIGQPATVRRYDTDRYGDRVAVTEFVVPHSAFSPQSSKEDTDRANTVTAEAELYVPPGYDIQATDEVELYDGSTWEVAGRAEPWRSPFDQWEPGTVIPLNRVTG